MKLSVFTVSTPDMTPEELAAAAKEAGLHGIEWRYKEVPAGAENDAPSYWGNNRCSISPFGDEAHLLRFKAAAEAHGLESVSVTPYLPEGDLEALERVLRAAVTVGAGRVRLAVPFYDRTRKFDDLFAAEREYLKQAEGLCRRYGVQGLIETHHVTIAASASAARRLCEGLDPEWIGVIYDPGNMVFEGFENYRMGLELLGPYLAHVHIKNAGWAEDGTGDDGATVWRCDWRGLERGIVQWGQLLEDLRSVGYEGYLGIEDFSGQFGSAQMLREFARLMRRHGA